MKPGKREMPPQQGGAENSAIKSELSSENHVNIDRNLLDLLIKSEALSKDIATRSEEFAKLIDRLVAESIERNAQGIFRRFLSENGKLLRSGRTAGQVWKESGLPAFRNAAQWLSRRLVKAGCQIGDERGELGHSTARLFDPDKVAGWLARSGKSEMEMYAKERIGQARFTF